MPSAPARLSVPVVAAAVLPPLVAFAVSVYVAVGWLVGTNPLWPTPELNVAEAAMVRDHAEVVRLIHAGQDPNRAWEIRSDIRNSDQPARMTPLEAAISIRRLELVQLLVREGARIGPAEREALVAFSRKYGAPDVAAYLESFPPLAHAQ
jgi:hypothetical protein